MDDEALSNFTFTVYNDSTTMVTTGLEPAEPKNYWAVILLILCVVVCQTGSD